MRYFSRFSISALLIFLFTSVEIIIWPSAVWAFFCGPQSLAVNKGSSVSYTISGDGVTVGSFEVSGGNPSIATITPTSVSSAKEGVFAVIGIEGGSTTFIFFWSFQNGSRSGSCSLSATVIGEVPTTEHPSQPPGDTSTPQPSEQPEETTTPSEDKPSPSQGKPKASDRPEVVKPRVNIFKDVIPQIPGYSTPGQSVEQGISKPGSGPMIPEGLRDHIRSFPRRKSLQVEQKPPVVIPEKKDPCEKLAEAKKKAIQKKNECEYLRRILKEAEHNLNETKEFMRNNVESNPGLPNYKEALAIWKEKIRKAEEKVNRIRQKLKECEEAQKEIEKDIEKFTGDCEKEKPGGTTAEPGGEGEGEKRTPVASTPKKPECSPEGSLKLLTLYDISFMCKVLNPDGKVGVKLVPEGVIRGSDEADHAVEDWILLMKCFQVAGDHSDKFLPEGTGAGASPFNLISYCFKAGEIFGEALLGLGKKLRHLDVTKLTGVLIIPIIKKRCTCNPWAKCIDGKWKIIDHVPPEFKGCDGSSDEQDKQVLSFPVDVQPRDSHSYNDAVEKIRQWMERTLANYPRKCDCPDK